MSITVTTQAELDAALKANASEIIIDSPAGVWLEIRNTDSSSVEAWDSSSVVAWGSSRVVARGSSRVVAWDSSRVVAWDSSRVVARDSSSVVARDSSRVVARGSSSVVARDSSSVVAWDSSRVVARDSSRVVARDSSRVEAGNYVAVHLHSGNATVEGGVIIDITKLNLDTHADWADYHGVKTVDGELVVYKAVDKDLKSGRGFNYPIGETVTAPDWDNHGGCGNGLHFSPSPAQARDYHREATRFLKCAVAITDLVILDGADIYTTPKLKALAARVVAEVDIHGDEIATEATK